ncbi:M48 family metalloprotease [Streptomyces sp. NBC_01214]|uniref:M48 family metalloprotease n=1 Tax=Streptomyces sp. NBC_01214 TaxID=2903777 RepID=UPI00225156F5|nr:M48 family metalloprotease [Streptomyces sp. NBC_01214]MCX4805111.1 M48 family metalloprotease [Streptomyces sp. NBC_01214]
MARPERRTHPGRHPDRFHGPRRLNDAGKGGPGGLEYRSRAGTRITYRARQRGVDATTWLHLALCLPAFLLSLAVVAGASLLGEAWLGVPAWLPATLWLVSGVLVFHRPTESFLARHLLRLHRPLPHEQALLGPLWHEVTARAGVDGSRYDLWIEDSSDLNAFAAAGHLVGVTRHALDHLPDAQLAAVLAHELGHHAGGHPWAGLLGQWYALPGRTLWRVAVRLAPRLRRSLSSTTAWVLTAGACWLAYTTLAASYGLPFLLLGLPWLTAAVGRRAELRADAHAAGLGFAPVLADLLEQSIAEEDGRSDRARRTGRFPAVSRLLSHHPDHRTRLHHLRKYL